MSWSWIIFAHIWRLVIMGETFGSSSSILFLNNLDYPLFNHINIYPRHQITSKWLYIGICMKFRLCSDIHINLLTPNCLILHIGGKSQDPFANPCNTYFNVVFISAWAVTICRKLVECIVVTPLSKWHGFQYHKSLNIAPIIIGMGEPHCLKKHEF